MCSYKKVYCFGVIFFMFFIFDVSSIAYAMDNTDKEEDKTLLYMVGDDPNKTTEVMGYVEAIKEVPLNDLTEKLLLNITYTDDSSFEASEKISDKIKSYTGFEGNITLDGEFDPVNLYKEAKNELIPSEQLDDLVTYNQLMLIADEAVKNNDVSGIYGAYLLYNSGLYKEAVIEKVKNDFYKSDPVNYANYMIVQTDGADNFDDSVMVVGRTFREVLGEFNSAYKKYQQFVLNSAEGYGYGITLPTLYGDLDVFPLFISEYAFFKYDAANVSTIEDMKKSFQQNFILKGSFDERNNITARRNIFQVQAIAGMFSNAITIREITQRYLNAKGDISAMGTEAKNSRSNWYALNILTSGLVQILGWEAVISANFVEYEGMLKIRQFDESDSWARGSK